MKSLFKACISLRRWGIFRLPGWLGVGGGVRVQADRAHLGFRVYRGLGFWGLGFRGF